MTSKLFYLLTKEQENITNEFLKINKIEATISDFVIDTLKKVSGDITNALPNMIELKKVTQEELDKEIVKFEGKLSKIPDNAQLKAIVLSGESIINGLVTACKINNISNRKNNMIIFSKVDDFVSEYISNEIQKLKAWLVNYKLQQEVEESKKLTNDAEIEQVKKDFKEKALKS